VHVYNYASLYATVMRDESELLIGRLDILSDDHLLALANLVSASGDLSGDYNVRM
jgi:hypothetical protein